MSDRRSTASASNSSAPPGGPSAAGGRVALVGGGPGAGDLITVRGWRLLSQADVVLPDRLAPRELLSELKPEVEIIEASKNSYGQGVDQDTINRTLVEQARAGKFVVRLKGGDPYVFGRGFEEWLACVDAGVPVEVVPGVSSAFAAPALAEVPVTHRGVTHEVVVVSGHAEPNEAESLVDWPALARLRGTLVLLMAVTNIEAIARALLENGRPADTPVAVIRNATVDSQFSVRTTLESLGSTVYEQGIRPPAVIVIGPVAGLAGVPST